MVYVPIKRESSKRKDGKVGIRGICQLGCSLNVFHQVSQIYVHDDHPCENGYWSEIYRSVVASAMLLSSSFHEREILGSLQILEVRLLHLHLPDEFDCHSSTVNLTDPVFRGRYHGRKKHHGQLAQSCDL
jgi:hypothetical protein